METSKKQKTDLFRSKILPILQDPVKLKLVVVYGICFVGFIAIGLPMYFRLKGLEQLLNRELDRKAQILSIQNIKAKQTIYNKYLNKNGTLNWWVEYILNASRTYNLRIKEYKPFEPKTAEARSGNFRGVLIRLKVMGEYRHFLSFVNWVESNKWGMRITRLSMEVQRNATIIDGTLTIAVMTVGAIMPEKVMKGAKGPSKKGKVADETE